MPRNALLPCLKIPMPNVKKNRTWSFASSKSWKMFAKRSKRKTRSNANENWSCEFGSERSMEKESEPLYNDSHRGNEDSRGEGELTKSSLKLLLGARRKLGWNMSCILFVCLFLLNMLHPLNVPTLKGVKNCFWFNSDDLYQKTKPNYSCQYLRNLSSKYQAEISEERF